MSRDAARRPPGASWRLGGSRTQSGWIGEGEQSPWTKDVVPGIDLLAWYWARGKGKGNRAARTGQSVLTLSHPSSNGGSRSSSG
jgi:hypothetical protein